VVIVNTGGGGALHKWLLSKPGLSSLLLEAVVPYDKHSCVDFLRVQGRSADGVGFCSEDMASLLASSARDRAMHLLPLLHLWPDVVGVASTATIISHFKRRGDYRVHAAAVDATGAGTTYTHVMVKGARERCGEDEACALLSLRALDAAVNGGNEELATHGIWTDAGDSTNALEEKASGVEAVPSPIPLKNLYAGSIHGEHVRVLVPGRVAPSLPSSLVAPRHTHKYAHA
jgi:hypothetical protein